MPELNAFEVEKANEKLKRPKSPGTDQISAELINAGGKTIRSEINKHINYVWNEEKLPEEWKKSIIVPIYKKAIKQIVVIIVAYHFCQVCTKFYPTSCCHV